MTNSTANSMAAMSSTASSDTMSEISDSGTGTSGRSYSDSREEMHQLATSLGLESADDLAKERFKVDRKKLEAMLHCKYFGKKTNKFFIFFIETQSKWFKINLNYTISILPK